ncbi:MAG: ligase-associated DNA damage response endonuclease PdeM [Rhizobiales bacterium]|nr:ligase-associated DNA damage response endonuclease PdeM [Hyphomicrobiales bacterium]
MAEARMAIAGCSAVLDPAGALWLPESRTLVVADLHLEKGSSFARCGMLLPPYDTGATLLLLDALIARRDPARVICLGDSFHDSGGYCRLSEENAIRLSVLQRGRDWVWISGNHDRVWPDAAGGEVAAELLLDGLLFRHEPRAGAAPGEVAGHLHPAGKVRGSGRAVRCRAFATDGVRIVLPAFGVLAGGLNVLDRAFAPLFAMHALRAILIGGGRLFPVAASALSPD